MYSVAQKVSKQCEDNPYGFNGVVVFDDGTYAVTQGCIPDMTGYDQHPTGRENGFIDGVIPADHQNTAPASLQTLPVNVAVTESAISPPMKTSNQLGGPRMDPPSTDGYDYGWGGNRPQLWERDEEHKEEEKKPHLKKKKIAKSRKRGRCWPC